MKFFTVLLLASLASISLAAIHQSEEEILLETQPANASAQSSPTSQTGKDSVPNDDLSTDPSILKEEMISKKNVMLNSIGPKSQKPELVQPTIQEDSFGNAEIQLETTIEFKPSSAATSESEPDNDSQEIKKKLEKAMKKFMGLLKDLISDAKDVISP